MYRVSKSNCLLILSGLIGRNVQTLYQVVWSAGRSSQMARRPMTWWMLCSQRYRQADQWIRVEQSILMDRYYTYHIIHVYTIFGSHYLGLCISHERLNWKWTKELIIKAFRERERGERELFKNFLFLLQGTGPSVPKYLRFDGPVRNRRLGKRDCLLLIRDIWREKAAHDASVSLLTSESVRTYWF